MYILDFEPAGQLQYAELRFKRTVSALASGEVEHLSSSRADRGKWKNDQNDYRIFIAQQSEQQPPPPRLNPTY